MDTKQPLLSCHSTGAGGGCLLSLLFITLLTTVPLMLLSPQFLFTPTWATGGDMASHLMYAKFFVDELWPQGSITGWMPESFAGYPFIVYYFPLPFIIIALLTHIVPFQIAFKLGTVLGTIVLPAATYGIFRWNRMGRGTSFLAGSAAVATMLHEEHSIWGGNLLSVLSGEFSYAYGMLFSTLFFGCACRWRGQFRYMIPLAGLETLTALSHGFALLLTGFSTLFFLTERGCFWRHATFFAGVHLIGAGLVAGWLFPFLEFTSLTTANDTAHFVRDWKCLLPPTVWPLAIAAGSALLFLALPSTRRRWKPDHVAFLIYLLFITALGVVGFVAGSQMGVADIRFFPMALLAGAMASALLVGQAVRALPHPSFLCVLASGGLLIFSTSSVKQTFAWSDWNFAGLEHKVRWEDFKAVSGTIQGDLTSPRLVFEHDPKNQDIGSTRTLEALPLFSERPVLEGLYMESAVLGPVIYQLQAEVSARPSSPLSRFPSTQRLNVDAAALHMHWLYANEVLVRSEKAKAAFERSERFTLHAEHGVFAIYRLTDFQSRFVEPVQVYPQIQPRDGWKEHAFGWFKGLRDPDEPVFIYAKEQAANHIRKLLPANKPSGTKTDDTANPKEQGMPEPPNEVTSITNLVIERERIAFTTTAPNTPHLVRMSYDPRWRAVDGSPSLLASPGFLLVYPLSHQVELRFGATQIGAIGRCTTWGTLLGSVLAVLVARRRAFPFVSACPLMHHEFRSSQTALWLWTFLTLVLFGFTLHATNSHTAYRKAHDYMEAKRYRRAVPLFLKAFKQRDHRAPQEEALFWAARASEHAADYRAACTYYEQLVNTFNGVWVAESLYRLIGLMTHYQNPSQAQRYASRLKRDYPVSPWTERLAP